ncbi:hypothetical protein Enr13x_18180 [Stieleria neptunia]|uniref:Uncharacterized protein n=1 Tax=Stieleria neptunia TaxID=2527979 RepID=A0A518HM98_9BACT|nr:hypothetical protein [Stieleria neptunia]QDV41975.1 hypothetical protein Enr13x_18180 [Stieleria neptunia]
MMRPSQSIAPKRFAATLMFAWCSLLVLASTNAAEPPQLRLAAANVPIPPGEAFQVTVEVFEVLGNEKLQLQDRHLLLFKGGKAYDFGLTEPRDVTLIDPVNSQVILLSRVDHVKATITHQEIVTAAARFRLFATNEGLETRLGIDAETTKEANQDNRYSIEFGDYHYSVTTAEPSMAAQPHRFAEFTDWVARVNLVRKLGTPPFARINLGNTIAADGLIPQTVTLTLKSQTRSRIFVSSYKFKPGLSKESQQRLDEVAGMLTLYRDVPLAAFPR